MWSVFIPADPSQIDLLSAELWESGTSGVVEEPSGLRAFFDNSIDQSVICAKFQVLETATQFEDPFDSNKSAPIACDPVLLGQHFFVAPSWVAEAPPEGRLRLSIDNTSAFGSGRHETTQMCIEALEKFLKPNDCVVDIGCGSGILSAAAQLLGAGSIFSCDIHEQSVRTSKALIQTPLFVGSADCLRSEVADLVLANISARILDIISPDLKRIVKPGGLIVLSGFIDERLPKNFHPWEAKKKGDWHCWICRQTDVISSRSSSEPATHDQQWWL